MPDFPACPSFSIHNMFRLVTVPVKHLPPLRESSELVNFDYPRLGIRPMGLQDRDYYRDEPRGFNSWAPGRATLGLIGVITGIYIIQLLTGPRGLDDLLRWGCFKLSLILEGEFWRVLTAPWLHDTSNLFPILFGMLVLYFFGRGLEDDLGGAEFLCFYFAALVVTQAAEFLARLSGLEDPARISFGSAGPVTAVLVLFACRHPREIVRLFFVLPVPMWALAVGIVAINLFAIAKPGGANDMAALPLSGAAFGYLYHAMSWRLSNYLPRQSGRFERRRPKLRVIPRDDENESRDFYEEPVVAEPLPRKSNLDEQFEAKLDHVLAKYSREGKESLTREEQEILNRASEVYRKRRPN